MKKQSPSLFAEKYIRGLFWVIGIGGILAFPFLILPDAVFIQLHEKLHLGPLEMNATVSYLARSLSLLYVASGIVTCAIAMELRRYRPLVKLWGFLAVIKGLVLTGVDLKLGIPWWWLIPEGAGAILIGISVIMLSSRIPESEVSSSKPE